MGKHAIGIGLVGVVAGLVSALSVFAAPRKPGKPAPQPEVYSAMEPETVRVPPVVVRPAAGITVRAARAPAPTKQALAHKLPESALAYDPVPSDQVDAISKRLQLVEALIRRHARAYDYRTHTVRDLEMILAKLDAASGAKPASVSQKEASPDAVPTGLPTPTEADEVAGKREEL